MTIEDTVTLSFSMEVDTSQEDAQAIQATLSTGKKVVQLLNDGSILIKDM